MDYQYENLGDERFQEFCQCLISKEFPDLQAFPVGQPDGGRDAIVYHNNKKDGKFIVFQVKFVRNPHTIPNVHKWLLQTIEEESPKIDQLIPDGAKEYYLLTNVKGTAHSKSGSIDKLNEILGKYISIPASCWWRDDLNRKFEQDPMFKWSFPEILNGQDMLNSILFENLNEHNVRRANVINAYLADQYKIDNKVKFRQVDLENNLFELFTDVPFRIHKYNRLNENIERTINLWGGAIENVNEGFPNTLAELKIDGAASFLLHPSIQKDLHRILLEGGPGQGKSTIAQYICQVHRSRLLGKQEVVGILPSNIRTTPIRLPFKIDLRHIATWVEGANPYEGRLNNDLFHRIYANSLESFLVGHIIYHSQILEFSTSDLISILKMSSVLFVFDGFDEIADFKIRSIVIDFINEGINRMSENSSSIQVLITSRPAAFNETAGFSSDDYPHFKLTDLTPTNAINYIGNWIKANKLDPNEGDRIMRLVEEKLQLPHIKELAKSPMQLAIFISLLRTRGESLPNKRTALYDSYIELFFNRESEKSAVIRDNRDLIINMHQYLAWILHSEAELHNNSGSISITRLHSKLEVYLTSLGHNTDITRSLFNAMQERVCALVSRVQGTYEFEVQPLREYFCAKYLYTTAQYSPTGFEKSGTKPDRFDAIARNYYWQNVVRFFAGCFDIGELPMLVLKLKELDNDFFLKNTNYPRLLISQILSDWVFAQNPILMAEVIKIVIDGIRNGRVIRQEDSIGGSEPIQIPKNCGGEEIETECFKLLSELPNADYANEIINIIKNNSYRTIELWSKYLQNYKGKFLCNWFEYGYQLGIVNFLDKEVLKQIMLEGSKKDIEIKLKILISSRRYDILYSNVALKEILFENIIQSKIVILDSDFNNKALQLFSVFQHPYLLSRILIEGPNNIGYFDFLKDHYNSFIPEESFDTIINNVKSYDKNDKRIVDFMIKMQDTFTTAKQKWQISLNPWNSYVEKYRIDFGETWTTRFIATVAAGIKSKAKIGIEYCDLTDNEISLCMRVRYARLQFANVEYWRKVIQNKTEIPFILLVLLKWSSPKVITSLLAEINIIIKELTEDDFAQLKYFFVNTRNITDFDNRQYEEYLSLLRSNKFEPELLYLLTFHLTETDRNALIYDKIDENTSKLTDIIEIKLYYLISQYLIDTKSNEILNDIKKLYSRFVKLENYNQSLSWYFLEFHLNADIKEIPIGTAQAIMSESNMYPSILVSVAESSCRLYSNQHVNHVGAVANAQEWFV